MKKGYITIAGKDFAPISVGFGECCLNCDVKLEFCYWQCHDFEETDTENVALKEVRHEEPTTFWRKVKKIFMPIESDTPF